MDTKYEVKITRQATEQMRETVGFPKKHALIDEEPWRTEGVRKVKVKNFPVYYWVDDENHKVQVTAVIYT